MRGSTVECDKIHDNKLCRLPIDIVRNFSGVDRIYLYDHNSSVPLAEGLEDLIVKGNVIIERFDGHHQKFRGGISKSFKDTAQVNYKELLHQ